MQLASLQCSSWCAKLCKGLQNASRLITAAAAQPPTLLLASESSFPKLFFKNVGHTHMSRGGPLGIPKWGSLGEYRILNSPFP